jgi:hypothetical protein
MYLRPSITTGIAGISITIASAGRASSGSLESGLEEGCKDPGECAGFFAAFKQLPGQRVHS